MKLIAQKIIRLSVAFLFIFFFFGVAIRCSDECQVANTYVYYEPVYSTPAQIKAAVTYQDPQPLQQIGKIYFKDQILFINEIGKGIHVINNRDPKNPVPIGFLKIPGNYDLAIMGNTLYADSFIDLVAFDVSNLSDIKEIARIEKLFDHHQSMGFLIDPVKGVVTDWKKVETVDVNNSCDYFMQPWGGYYYRGGVIFDASASFSAQAAVAPNKNNAGIGGSLARFTIADNHLYALDASFLDIVSLEQPVQPKATKEIQLNWDVETLFPYESSLFIGARTGMYIYDLTNPAQPTLTSHFRHMLSCDPVVVEGDYAFVTLRNGNACGNTQSQLQVVDIKDLKNPQLVTTYPMVNPYGLGIDKGVLFICDGTDGLKIYDASNVNAIAANRLAHYKQMNALDIIPFQKVAMMITTDGLYQYDYSDIKNIKELSRLTILKP